MYKCVIIDDEELARELIQTHVSQLDDFELVASCASAIEASKVLQQETVDLLFLDIEMPVLKGTDFFKNIVNKPKVIFVTAYRDYALDGFELNAVDYLLKPITFARFFNAIEKFKAQQQIPIDGEAPIPIQLKSDYIFVTKNRKKIKIIFDNILYIESIKDYIRIHLINESITIKFSISAFQKELDTRFIRIHRSYIVNHDKITAYTKHDIEIEKIELPVGENYKKNIINL
ncbi:LytR/AlgR family response regulator transcription factor [Flavivirga spongiicola]|uniref:LytTR family DNA-binding domain-containing protein n=1 Tax=Flavivirga spongiicola TaxID=421621 RepID=A0ABU7XXS7_9FLAO|nr:LytTR family DNA-binding domain-containing protein [Flavivirga sp. MEBiC05379]MDO5980606.1 LytTR family DNA-binding domain-containing protein [Flavivirga sp. MEBiC05379]